MVVSLARCITATVLAMTMCEAQPAAQTVARWEITPAAGIAVDGDLDGGMAAFGVSIGARTGRLIVAEAELLRISVSSSRHIDRFGGNVLIPARASGPRLFGLVGIGAGHFVRKQLREPDLVNTHLAFNFGGGVLIPVSPRISVRSDVRWLAFLAGDDAYHVTRVTAGTGFRF
jgi:opacity protein-like surface antigen